jgi:hypothetical protein
MRSKALNSAIIIYIPNYGKAPLLLIRLATLKRSLKVLPILTTIFCLSWHINAQEVTRSLNVNPELLKVKSKVHNVDAKAYKIKAANVISDTLELPFTDDFSYSSVYPDSTLWIDKGAFINSSYPINPVSIGVATLDAIDQNGRIYANASPSPFYADSLTSRPINLATVGSDSIFLSFFYQPQGLGDNPEPGDSLLVDFYNPESSEWKNEWKIPGTTTHPFVQIVLPILEKYHRKGFQFRFRNMASIDASEEVGRHGNVDQWNIDYVRLKKAPDRFTDTALNDVAFVKPLQSLLKTYQSMPWKHYLLAFRHEIKPTIDVTYRNNSSNPLFPKLAFNIKEVRYYNNGYETNIDAGAVTIDPFSNAFVQSNLSNPFSPDSIGKTIQFDVKGTLQISDINHNNDTVRFRQIFSNYFAYDDGTSESGYGVIGQGAQEARIAYAFNAYKQDTLKGVSIYFNPTAKDTTVSYTFKLGVWADNNGIPGQLLYESGEISPKTGLLNEFQPFVLDEGVVLTDRFYVGWLQVTDDYLNIGLDLNNNNQDKLFVNISGTWQSSIIPGSLMIRPLFGYVKDVTTGVTPTPTTATTFTVYPNPAMTTVTIIRSAAMENKTLSARIYDITGKLSLSALVDENTINVTNLPNGLYLLQLSDGKTNFTPVKLLIQH